MVRYTALLKYYAVVRYTALVKFAMALYAEVMCNTEVMCDTMWQGMINEVVTQDYMVRCNCLIMCGKMQNL